MLFFSNNEQNCSISSMETDSFALHVTVLLQGNGFRYLVGLNWETLASNLRFLLSSSAIKGERLTACSY